MSKDDRSFPFDYYHKDDLARSCHKLKTLAYTNVKVKCDEEHMPLLYIEPNHFVPDKLHLLLRIMDVLLCNMIDEALANVNFTKIIGQPTDNVNLLVNAIQSCGVSFSIWQSKSGDLGWTSIAGNEMKKLLVNLPDKLMFCLHNETYQTVNDLWKYFLAIYEKITSSVINESGENI